MQSASRPDDDESAVVALTASMSLADNNRTHPLANSNGRTLRSAAAKKTANATAQDKENRPLSSTTTTFAAATTRPPSTPTGKIAAALVPVTPGNTDDYDHHLVTTPTPSLRAQLDDAAKNQQHEETGGDDTTPRPVPASINFVPSGSTPKTPARKTAAAVAVSTPSEPAVKSTVDKTAAAGRKSVEFARGTVDKQRSVKVRPRDTPARPPWNSRFASESKAVSSPVEVRSRKTPAAKLQNAAEPTAAKLVASPRTPHVSQTNVKRQRQVSQLSRPILQPEVKKSGENVFLIPQVKAKPQTISEVGSTVARNEHDTLALVKMLRQELAEARKETSAVAAKLEVALEAKSTLEMELTLMKDRIDALQQGPK